MSFLQTSTSLGEKLRRNLISAKNVVIFHIKGKNMKFPEALFKK